MLGQVTEDINRLVRKKYIDYKALELVPSDSTKLM